jgi:hypothetical protein
MSDTSPLPPPPGSDYEIRIRGSLHPRWHEWFDGFTLSGLENGDTLLRGRIVDQSALHSVLNRIHDLNLKLVSVNCVEWTHVNNSS